MTDSDPVWLESEVVVRLNANLVAVHGGAGAALRDATLLGSALARPRNLFAYATRTPGLAALAASYAYGLARNHAFVDGNKRTALLALYVFLRRNGQNFDAPQSEAVVAMEQVARGAISEAALAAWVAAHSTPEP